MVLPKSVARFNRRATNRIIGRFADRLPTFGVIVHVGRKSGRKYRTPVSVFPTEGGYLVALTYGPETDWVRNVLAAAGCQLVTRGRTVRLGTPELVHDPSRRGVPVAVRQVLRLINATDFLSLRVVG
ncbi:MAG TPA: nitroreductase family deazaflavin-dependent oxidoreductase [Pseudonocardiaceae bacterium]|nr:nitroreductase family deazaflavin-dependent oxidoreductase [Pseudonocardiaceae bacterium]